MRRIVLVLVLSILSVLAAQTPDWQWAKRTGGTGSDGGSDITVDDSGNTYVTGYFQNYVSFGSNMLASSGSSDVYVAKADVNGNWLWASRAGGTGMDSGGSICTDSNGNSYITGRFQGTATFGSTMFSAVGDDIFVAKLDAQGNWLWAKRAGGTSIDTGESVSVDSNGNCYVTGGFQDTAYFGSTSLTSFGPFYTNCFVAKLDTNGNWLWAVNTGIGHGKGINTDSDGNSYVTGNYHGLWTLGVVTLEGDGIFIAKLNTNGNCLWAKRAGDSNDIVADLSNDNYGNSYVAGNFAGTIEFDIISLTSTGNRDGYIAKLDNNGNWLWAEPIEGSGEAQARAIAVDGNGNCFVTGSFVETATFGTTSITSSGSYDVFACVLDANGIWLKVSKAGGIEEERSNGITTDGHGSCYVTGYFRGTAYFGSTSLVATGTSEDMFTTKLSPPDPFLVATNDINLVTGYLGYYADNQDLTLYNYGVSDLTLSSYSFLATNSSFEIIAPSFPCSVAPNGSVNIHLRFTPLVSGSVTDSLLINNNSLNMPIAKFRLSGTGVIVPPKPPQNLQVVMDSNDVELSWESVTETIFNTPVMPDYYFVYNANKPEGEYVLHGLTQNLYYVHHFIAIGARRMFYKVTAVKFYRNDLTSQGLDAYIKENITPSMTEGEVKRFMLTGSN